MTTTTPSPATNRRQYGNQHSLVRWHSRSSLTSFSPFAASFCSWQIKNRSIPAFPDLPSPPPPPRDTIIHARVNALATDDSPPIGADPPRQIRHPLSRALSPAFPNDLALPRHSGTDRRASVPPLSPRSANARLKAKMVYGSSTILPISAGTRDREKIALSRRTHSRTPRKHSRRGDPLSREGVAPPPSCGSPRRDGTRKRSAVCVALG